MKADLPKREPEILARWEAMDLYGQIQQARQGHETFLLHDGPPYANGDIHIGHALNKILKDLIVRYKTMRGFASPYVPGWDCHGMPIEHQLFKELKLTKHQIDQTAFRDKARAYAQRYVDIQRSQFKRLGVLGDWERSYLTMSTDYELTILRTFKELVQHGFIYRGKKPVYWCPTCETALAEAEVEYEDRQDTSIYVAFPLIKPPSDVTSQEGYQQGWWDGADVVVWTTTPWTLPANVALCFHPRVRYALVLTRTQTGQEQKLVIASERLDAVLSVLKLTHVQTLQQVDGRLIAPPILGQLMTGLLCKHPFGRTWSVGVTDESVSMEEGTGIVHIAPGHGQEDYLIGQQHKLETLSPVDHQGRFTKEVPQWAGKTVWEANPQIIEDLRRRGLLLKEESVTHSYPHCWRCKQPVIFRATPQWFFRVDDAFRSKLLECAKQVRWIPEMGYSRMSGMLENRPDWCLSRQRYWGSPIPVFHCRRCEQPLLDARVIEQTLQALTSRGIEAWFADSPEQLVPGVACPCGSRELKKDADILDVWFDSGVSHEAVLKTRPGLRWPADLYLEGSDQHRGWFQVSLIPSVALRGRPPYRQVLTHGFVVDGQGRKMSKTLGNVIAPQQVIERSGADILRLWVASTDYSEDVRLSDAILEQVIEAYRKIRNTFRYLLANLYDFQPARDALPYERLPELDRWALHRLQRFLDEAAKAYDEYQFHQVFRAAYQLCVLDLSAFYLDALKDRLYTDAAGSCRRRCAQTTLYAILTGLARALAPMLAMTAEEVWQAMRSLRLAEEPSVHLASWPARVIDGVDEDLERRWKAFFSVRQDVMKALEQQREANVIGSPLEARVTVATPDDALRRLLQEHQHTLAEAFIVSEFRVSDQGAGVTVERAPGAKCRRCWKYQETVGTDPAHPALCDRCASVVNARTP